MMHLKTVAKGTYIQFLDAGYSDTGKTLVFDVATIEDKEDILGRITFDAGWWCYSFSPYDRTKYEKTCLREIADFCEAETKKWREELRLKTQQKEKVEREEGDVEVRVDGVYRLSELTVYSDNSRIGIWIKQKA